MNYKPLSATIAASTINKANGSKVMKDIDTSLWNLALIYGTALGVSGTAIIVLKSGTVLGWYSNVAGEESAAAIQTFTNSNGRYGVTVNTGAPLTIKFYAHG